MSSITIHDLDADLDRRLSLEARRNKMSKNQLVKDLLTRSLGMPVEGTYSDAYREFCGLWSADDLVAFNSSQAENSSIDAGDWQP